MSDLQKLKATASPSPSARHDAIEAAEVMEQVLEMYRTGNLRSLIDVLAEDAVMEFPFAPPGRPQRIEGKNNIIAYNQAILGIATFTGFTGVEIHRMVDSDCVVIEMTGHGTVRATGNAFERRYIDVCRTKNGRIQLIRDYWNPQESQISKDNGATQRG